MNYQPSPQYRHTLFRWIRKTVEKCQIFQSFILQEQIVKIAMGVTVCLRLSLIWAEQSNHADEGMFLKLQGLSFEKEQPSTISLSPM